MKLLLTILLLALTRAEILERLRAVPIVNTEGLIAVYANCDAYQRRTYQRAVASAAYEICGHLYGSFLEKPRRFEHPGIAISIGDGRGPDTNVYYAVETHPTGEAYAHIRLPSPGYSSREAFRNAVARGFELAVHTNELDAAAAHRLLRASDPALRAEDRLNALRAWLAEGVFVPGHEDSDYLDDLRHVNLPGVILPEELRIFVSRLYLYPPAYDAPFGGHWRELPFREAIPLARTDPRIRPAAAGKVTELTALGGGHGPAMNAVVEAYCAFLNALAAGEKPDDELGRMLSDAELKLKGITP